MFFVSKKIVRQQYLQIEAETEENTTLASKLANSIVIDTVI